MRTSNKLFASGDAEGEGESTVGAATASGSGVFTFTVDALGDRYLTTTATDVVSGTSGFSAAFTPTVRAICLPVVLNGH
jgi:hypothetical protein